MKIRTAKDLIAVARARGFGFRVDLGPPPQPYLVSRNNTKRLATEALLNALKAFRVEVMEELAKETMRTLETQTVWLLGAAAARD